MRFSIFILLSAFYSVAQNIEFEKTETMQVTPEVFWGKDIFGNQYYSTNNNLYKLNENDTINYTNNKFGKIASVETNIMLQTLVFYKQNNAFVLLDAQFNEIKSTIFTDISCEIIKPASQNELWFYDSLRMQIGLYNLNSQKSRFLSNPLNLTIKETYSDYNYFCWIDATNEIFSINKFGKISNLGKLKTFDKVTFFDTQNLIYLFEDELFTFSIENQSENKLGIEEKSIKNFFCKNRILTIFTHKHISTYQLKK